VPGIQAADRIGLLCAVLAAVGFSFKAILVKLAYRYGVDAETLLALRMACSLPFFLGMGLIARLMPTLQVFFVVMPLQLLVGFGLMAVTVSASMIWFLEVYRDHLSGFVE